MRRIAVGATLAVCFVTASMLVAFGTSTEPETVSAKTALADSAGLPAAPALGLRIPRPSLLKNSASLARWSPVLKPVTARTKPSTEAAAVAQLSTLTPEGTSNLVVVLERATDESGELWVRVQLPVLPANTTGWVPRRTLGGYTLVRTRLLVELERFTATLFSNGQPIFKAPVGVGKPEWPTPTGEFYVRDKLASYASPFYGPIAFGTSARSAVLTDWPAGGFIGIHGTSQPELLPGRVSHGCIRMRNADILRLARLMPVGTPLTIV